MGAHRWRASRPIVSSASIDPVGSAVNVSALAVRFLRIARRLNKDNDDAAGTTRENTYAFHIADESPRFSRLDLGRRRRPGGRGRDARPDRPGGEDRSLAQRCRAGVESHQRGAALRLQRRDVGSLYLRRADPRGPDRADQFRDLRHRYDGDRRGSGHQQSALHRRRSVRRPEPRHAHGRHAVQMVRSGRQDHRCRAGHLGACVVLHCRKGRRSRHRQDQDDQRLRRRHRGGGVAPRGRRRRCAVHPAMRPACDHRRRSLSAEARHWFVVARLRELRPARHHRASVQQDLGDQFYEGVSRQHAGDSGRPGVHAPGDDCHRHHPRGRGDVVPQSGVQREDRRERDRRRRQARATVRLHQVGCLRQSRKPDRLRPADGGKRQDP